jgi:Spy/CpxP family protein refolding chaperone
MRRTLRAVAWIVVAAALCPLAGQAQEEEREGWWTRPKALEALDLTPNQQAQIEQLEQDKRERIRESRRAIISAMRQLLTALDDASVQDAAIQGKRARLEQAWINHLQVTIDHWQQLRPILRDEQWQALPSAAPQALRLGMVQVRSRQRTEVSD